MADARRDRRRPHRRGIEVRYQAGDSTVFGVERNVESDMIVIVRTDIAFRAAVDARGHIGRWVAERWLTGPWMRRALLVLGLLACGQVRDVETLTRAVQEQFKQPARITMSSTGNLDLILPAEPMAKISYPDRKAYANNVARFAYAHYAHPTHVHSVSVSFESQSVTGSGSVGEFLEGGQWEAWELTDASTPRDIAHASRQVVWVAIGDRNAPARIDVDESRLKQASGDTPEEIFVRVLYDSAVTAPSGQRVASVEIHYRVTCSTASSTMLGGEAYAPTGQAVQTIASADSLPAWMEPHGMQVQRSALKGYCHVFYPSHQYGS